MDLVSHRSKGQIYYNNAIIIKRKRQESQTVTARWRSISKWNNSEKMANVFAAHKDNQGTHCKWHDLLLK